MDPHATIRLLPLALALILGSMGGSPAAAQQVAVDGASASPTLTRLALEAAEDPDALNRFWSDRAARGTPLVEPVDSLPGHSLVTFLHRSASGIHGVRLESNLNVLLLEYPGQPPEELGALRPLDGTDVLHLTFRLRNDVRVPYRFEVETDSGTVSMLDTLNPRVWEPDQQALAASILELDGAPPQPWRTSTGEEGEGDWDRWRFEEAPDSGRMVYIYKPPGWSNERDGVHPVLVGLGAFGHGIGMRVDRIVDHLVRTGRIPPIVVVLVDIERDAEQTRYRSTGEFVAERLLPMLRDNYAATADPERIVVSGTSRRGMIASLVAFRHPDAVRNVLSLSGSYYWSPTEELEWVPALYSVASRRPLRFFVTAGELETWVTPTNRGHPLLVTNRHFRNVLRATGYPLTYREFNGVHSELSWQDELALGLGVLLGS